MDQILHIGCCNALGAAGLAVVAAVVGRLGSRPALTRSLWLLVLLKLVTPPFFPVTIPWPTGWQHKSAEAARTSAGAADVCQQESLPPGPGAETTEEFTLQSAPALEISPLASAPGSNSLPGDSSESGNQPRAKETAITGESQPFSWQGLLVSVWLIGSASWLLLAGVRLQRFHRLIRYTQPAPPEVQQQTRALACRLGLARSPDVWLAPAAISPMLWAMIGPPRLLVPSDLWNRLTVEERETLLVHELAHWRRRDHWVRYLEMLVLGLYWWHPVAWWARRELREAEEQCCDALVLAVLPAAAPAYARTLVETIAFLSDVRPALPLAASGIGDVKVLKRRLTMIMRGTTSGQALGWVTFLLLLGVGAVLLPLWPTWAEPPATLVLAQETTPEDPPANAEPAVDFLVQAGPPAAPVIQPPQTAEGSRRSVSLQAARDEIELLEVQLQGRKAEAQEVLIRIRMAQRRLDRIKNLAGRGAISNEELETAKDEVELLTAQLAPKEAQIKEAEIRLRQARNRLGSVERRQASNSVPVQPTPVALSAGYPATAAADPTAKTPARYTGSFVGTTASTVGSTAKMPTASSGSTSASSAQPAFPGTSGLPSTYSRSGMGPSTSSTGSETASTDHEARLRNLEKKMDELLRAVNSLRREIRPERQPDDANSSKDGKYYRRSVEQVLPREER